MTIATQEDEEYRNKITECLKCCGEYHWVAVTIKKIPSDIDTFEKDKQWYELQPVDKTAAGINRELCDDFYKGLKKEKFIYISKKFPGNGERQDNAGGRETGLKQGVHISPSIDVKGPVQKIGDDKKPLIDKGGEPIYVEETFDFCSILWHELVGHAINGKVGHPVNDWNDHARRNDSPKPENWGTVDPAVEIENKYRAHRGWPLRRPQYWDETHRP
jgi:hypothetical protein